MKPGQINEVHVQVGGIDKEMFLWSLLSLPQDDGGWGESLPQYQELKQNPSTLILHFYLYLDIITKDHKNKTIKIAD